MPNGRLPSSASEASGSDPSAGAGSPGGSEDGTPSSKQRPVDVPPSANGETPATRSRVDNGMEEVVGDPLDAYSAIVVRVAESLTSRVASLRIRSGRGESAGSGVVLTAE